MSHVTTRVAELAHQAFKAAYPEIDARKLEGLKFIVCDEEGYRLHCVPGSDAERYVRDLLRGQHYVDFDVDGIRWQLRLQIETRSQARARAL